MKLGYTEFSFGYAFTENLIRSSAAGPKTAPVFPNLSQEAYLGYDVKIDLPGLPLFFQYKLPELMTRDTAREIATYNLLGLTTPFFRMPLMPSGLSRQHELLIKLEKKYPNAVFYASPRMQNGQAFNSAYVKGKVHRRSVFFSPTGIGPLPDPKAHSIAYRDGLAQAWLCSEPKEIASTSFEALEHRILADFEQTRFHTLRAAAPEVRELMRAIVSTPMREAEASIAEQVRARRVTEAPIAAQPLEQPVEDILVAREMARIDLGVELMLAQPREAAADLS
jgi:hypothetical protein